MKDKSLKEAQKKEEIAKRIKQKSKGQKVYENKGRKESKLEDSLFKQN